MPLEEVPWQRGYNRDLEENLERNGIDLIGQRVLFDISLILKSEPDVYLYLPCEAVVQGPNSGTHLSTHHDSVSSYLFNTYVDSWLAMVLS